MNQLPEVRRWVMEDSENYVGVKLNFVPGHPPNIHFFDNDGAEEEVVDMSSYSYDGLKELLVSRGMLRKEIL